MADFEEIKKLHLFKKKLHAALVFYRKRNEEFIENEGMSEVLNFLLIKNDQYKNTFHLQPKEIQSALYECAKILINVLNELSKEKLNKSFIISELKKCTNLSLILNEPPTSTKL